MWALLRVWIVTVGRKLKQYWLVWFISAATYVVRSLLEDRATNATNTWLDNHLPAAVKAIWDNMPLFPQSELGVVGWLFVLTILGIMIWAYVDTRGNQQLAPLAPLVPLASLAPLRDSPQDVAIRDKIKVLFLSCGDPAYADMQGLTNSLCYRFTHDPDRDLRDPLIATLAGNYAFAPCNHAGSALSTAINSASTLEVLHKCLKKFVRAYRLHVRWMHMIAPYAPLPALNEDASYAPWQEKHKLFRQELRKLAATDDFAYLRNEIEGGWQDTWGAGG